MYHIYFMTKAELTNIKKISDFVNKSLLIVDDDNPFRDRLARAMEKKGFEVFQAEGVQKGIQLVKKLYIGGELSLNLINVKQIIDVEIIKLSTILIVWLK